MLDRLGLLALMSLTCPPAHDDEAAWGSTFVLVRALLSFIGLKRLMAKLSPHDPEMWLDLEPIPHRCYAHLAADRQIPRGFSTVLPRC